MPNQPKLSIVVPVLDEEENVGPLAEKVRAALGDNDWELIFVNDGSTDSTAQVVAGLGEADPRVRLVSLARRYGQSTAMQAGFDHCRGEVVVTMDGDLQNDPADIPALLDKLAEGYDLVAGYRMARQDKWLTRKIPSKIANRIIRWITNVPIRDNGCSLKAYRRELLERMRLYSDLHRFIPALAAGTAAARIAELEVRHHPRIAGESSYGLSRVGKVLADLITVKMIRSFRLRPLRLFSLWAMAPLLAALLLGVAASASLLFNSYRWVDIGLSFGSVVLLLIALSAYLLMLGLLAEFFIRSKRRQGAVSAPARGELLA
ncbi:MAG: glycosyltransferase family 2 protein [Gemmatimonadetes bacterium]|nr:glycosyltransferase family 2 protein [Gemmatimonadota bacterium]